jgi:hypothetical protein
MSNQDQVMTQYLLGSLSEAETERLDELSVTSQEFAESLSASEKDLIDAYVQGELSGTTLAQFESRYLASPIRRGRVEFAEAFQVFAKNQKVVNDPGTRRAIALDKKAKGSWFSKIFPKQQAALQWGLAIVALIFIVVSAILLLRNSRLHQQMSLDQAELQQREIQLKKELDDQRASKIRIEQELTRIREERQQLEDKLKNSGQLSTIFSFVLTPQLRGVGQAKSVSLPANTSHVKVQLNLEPNDYQTFVVALIDQSNHQELWTSGKLKTNSRGDDKRLNVSFSATLLKAQHYSLRVSGISANGQSEVLSDYPFNVSKSSTQ